MRSCEIYGDISKHIKSQDNWSTNCRNNLVDKVQDAIWLYKGTMSDLLPLAWEEPDDEDTIGIEDLLKISDDPIQWIQSLGLSQAQDTPPVSWAGVVRGSPSQPGVITPGIHERDIPSRTSMSTQATPLPPSEGTAQIARSPKYFEYLGNPVTGSNLSNEQVDEAKILMKALQPSPGTSLRRCL